MNETPIHAELRNGFPKNSPRTMIGISIANPRCYGEYFRLSLEQFKQSNICELLLLLGDTLYAQNLKSGQNPSEENINEGRKLGDEWIAMHKSMIKNSGIDVMVVRFDDLSFTDPKYKEHERAMLRLFREDEAFAESVEYSIQNFLNRSTSVNRTHQQAKDYFFEELPVFRWMCLEPFKGGWVDAFCYGGSFPEAMKYLVKWCNKNGQRERPPIKFCEIHFSFPKS